MPDDHAETLDDPLFQQAAQARDHLVFVQTDPPADFGIGFGHQRQPGLDGGDQRLVVAVQNGRDGPACRLARHFHVHCRSNPRSM